MNRLLDHAALDLQEFDKHLEHGFHVDEITVFSGVDGRCLQGARRALVGFASARNSPEPREARTVKARAASGKEIARTPQRAILAKNDGGTNRPRARPTTSVAVPPLASRPRVFDRPTLE